MRRMCRCSLGSFRRRRGFANEELVRRIRIVTDPAKLAYLHAEARKLCAKEDSSPVSIRFSAMAEKIVPDASLTH